jgi:hypothetical protein
MVRDVNLKVEFFYKSKPKKLKTNYNLKRSCIFFNIG